MNALRAFLWLRWRLTVNGLFGGRGRDWMARLATWAAVLVRIVLGVLLLGAVVTISVVAGVLAGRLVQPGGLGPEVAILGFRVVLGVLSVVLVLFPLLTRSGGDLASAQRLRLLPLRQRHLHLLDVVGAFADPWLLSVSPVPFVLTGVFLWHGRWAWAAVALVGGLFLLASLALAATVVRRAVGLVLRDRRRAETAALLLILGLMVFSAGSAWLGPRLEKAAQEDTAETGENVSGEAVSGGAVSGEPVSGEAVSGEPVSGEAVSGEAEQPDPVEALRQVARSFPAALQVLPSELFVHALVAARDGRPGVVAGCLLGLAALAAVLLWIAGRLFRATVGSPGVSGRVRRSRRLAAFDRLPGLSPAASAVAWAQVTTAVRTLPGKLALAMPTLVMLILIVPLRVVMAEESSFVLHLFDGPQLALGAVAFALLGIQPFAFNQFAADGEGLARQILVPLSPRDLLLGKAAGLGLLVTLSAAVAVVASAALVARGGVGSWLALLLAVVPVYLLMAPVSVVLSLYFPKAMDLGGLGNKSKPHQLATLLGLLALLVVLGPVFGVVGLGVGLLGAPWWTLAVVAVLTLAAAAAGLVFLHFAAPVVPARTEAILGALRDG